MPEQKYLRSEPFSVKFYSGDERPTLKGNGFDGLEIGETREEAESFVKWLNDRLFRLWQLQQDDID